MTDGGGLMAFEAPDDDAALRHAATTPLPAGDPADSDGRPVTAEIGVFRLFDDGSEDEYIGFVDRRLQ
jgi:hypothetical protein